MMGCVLMQTFVECLVRFGDQKICMGAGKNVSVKLVRRCLNEGVPLPTGRRDGKHRGVGKFSLRATVLFVWRGLANLFAFARCSGARWLSFGLEATLDAAGPPKAF